MADAGVVDQDVEAADIWTAAAMESGLVTSRWIACDEPTDRRELRRREIDVGDPDEGAGADEFFTVASPMPLAPPVTRAWRPSRPKACAAGEPFAGVI